MIAGIVLVAVILQGIVLLVSLADAASLGAAFGAAGAAAAWLTTAFVVLSFTFIVATLLAQRGRHRFIDWFYAAASYWFGLVHFLFGGTVLFYLFAQCLYGANYYVPPPLLGVICFAPALLLHLYGTRQSGRVKTTKISVALPGLPAAWRGKTIAFASDLHLGCIRREAFAAQVARKTAALRPELFIIGGDLYDGPACDEAKLIQPLRGLVAGLPHGAYFVAGNHEYFLPDPARAFAAIREAGIRILDNDAADINGLRILGVDYLKARSRDGFRTSLAAANGRLAGGDPAKPTILVKHEPNDLEVARDAGVAFGLFGHTHHGQIWPLTYLTRQIYKGFDYGLKKLGTMQVYTSSGAGTWGPPLRLGTRSEIVAITLL